MGCGRSENRVGVFIGGLGMKFGIFCNFFSNFLEFKRSNNG
jgi:hypothetical protein